MKRIFLMATAILLGMAIGGGTAYATGKLLAGKPFFQSIVRPVFVPTGPIVAPLVAQDGHLLGYMSFEVQLEVPSNQAEQVRANLPLLLDAATLRSFKAPIAGGPDGLVPKMAIVRSVVTEAARQTYGSSVTRIAITQAKML